MYNWIITNIPAIGLCVALATFLLALGTLAFSAWRFVTTRRDAQRQMEFENYHHLIAQLVGSQRETETMKLDSQVAIVYELHHFERYKPVTVRILKSLKSEWSGNGNNNSRLIQEIEIAINKLS